MGDASSEVRSSASGMRPGSGAGASGDYEYDYTNSLADSPSGAASGERLSSAAALSSIDESRSALVRLLQEGHDGTPGAVDSFLSETASINRPNNYTSFRPEPISAAPVPEPAAVTAPVTPNKPQVRSAPRAKTSASTPTRARVEGRLLRDGDEQVNLASPTHTDENMMSDDEGRMVADVIPPPNSNPPQPPTATPAATANTRAHPPTSRPDTTTTTPPPPTSAPKPPATRPVGAQPKDNRSGSRFGLLIKLGVVVGAAAIVLKVAHTHQQQRNSTNKSVPIKVNAANNNNKGVAKKVAVINPNPKQLTSAQEKKLPASVVPVVPTTRSKFYSQAPSTKGNNGQPDVLAGRG
eukprot:jgi/Chlat1/7919/Chrsp68S07384